MSFMDHSEALRLHAPEKYVLGELSSELREQYEEHYFDCEECASELKTVVAFADTARELLRKPEPYRISGWFAWLRPVVAVPAFAALLLIVSYQSFVTIPRLQRQAATQAVQPADFVSLIGANSRAEGSKVFQLHRDRPVILEVDIPPSAAFASYICQVQNAAGATIYTTRASAADAKNTVHVVIPAGSRKAGEYTLLIFGQPSSAYNAASPSEIERLRFSVELLP
jgi:hypothetical protein